MTAVDASQYWEDTMRRLTLAIVLLLLVGVPIMVYAQATTSVPVTVYSAETLNIRSGPGTNYNTIGVVSGEVNWNRTVVASNGKLWREINFYDETAEAVVTGYVADWLLDQSEAQVWADCYAVGVSAYEGFPILIYASDSAEKVFLWVTDGYGLWYEFPNDVDTGYSIADWKRTGMSITTDDDSGVEHTNSWSVAQLSTEAAGGYVTTDGHSFTPIMTSTACREKASQ
jgi:uncharacterized protein YgiM (DUF1202 family)